MFRISFCYKKKYCKLQPTKTKPTVTISECSAYYQDFPSIKHDNKIKIYLGLSILFFFLTTVLCLALITIEGSFGIDFTPNTIILITIFIFNFLVSSMSWAIHNNCMRSTGCTLVTNPDYPEKWDCIQRKLYKISQSLAIFIGIILGLSIILFGSIIYIHVKD